MGTVELIRADRIEIDIEGLDVDRSVRCVGDAVDANHGTGVVRFGGDLSDVVDIAGNVGDVREGNQPRPIRQQLVQVVDIEDSGVGVDWPFDGVDAEFGQSPPGSGIRLVVEFGDDDFVAFAPKRPQRLQ